MFSAIFERIQVSRASTTGSAFYTGSHKTSIAADGSKPVGLVLSRERSSTMQIEPFERQCRQFRVRASVTWQAGRPGVRRTLLSVELMGAGVALACSGRIYS